MPNNNYDNSLAGIINDIDNQIPYVDKKPYSHNIISFSLAQIDRLHGGKEVVNKIIIEKGLDKLGWRVISQ